MALGAFTLFAHRGASAELPENTLPAFRRAVEVGADAIETDAHVTRDGHAVLLHDPTGARTCGDPRPVAACTLDEVRAWDARAGFAAGSARYQVPTLSDALEELPDTPFNVDCKDDDPRAIAALVEILRRHRAESRVRVASFDARVLRQVRRAGYAGKTGLARAEIARLVAAPRVLLRLAPLAGDAAQIPTRAYGVPLDTRALVDKAHALGIAVHYWTIDDPREAARLAALGADGIVTNDPRTISRALRAA